MLLLQPSPSVVAVIVGDDGGRSISGQFEQNKFDDKKALPLKALAAMMAPTLIAKVNTTRLSGRWRPPPPPPVSDRR